MTVTEAERSEAERRQAQLAPKEDLAEYAGQWVAVRDGRVVASDLDPEALRRQPGVLKSDVLVGVDDPDVGLFV